MKKSLLCVLTFGIAMIFSSAADSQILKKIQNAAAQGAQNALEKKASSEAEKATAKKLEGLSGMMTGLEAPEKIESEYSFSGYMVMEVTSTDEKGKSSDPTQIKTYLSESANFSGMEFFDPKNPNLVTTMIMDAGNKASVILMNDSGEKSSMAFKADYDQVQQTVDQESEKELESGNYKLEKTGKTKTILGYDCVEYFVKNSDGEGYYWVTEKPIAGYSTFSAGGNPMVSDKTIDRYSSYFSNAPIGSFMELIFTSTDGSVSEMKVVEVEPSSSKTFNMSEYPNLNAGSEK
ncbi:MAG: DUF4412 domain-containing protein [Algoriphagus sp.]|nr:DUF4412 domain-containing protein [Algoriphagus sp.]